MPDEISAATALPKAAIEQAQRAQSPAEAVFWIVAACALGALGLLGFLVYKRATSPALPVAPGLTREEVKALLLETLAKPAAPSDSQQTRALLIRATAAIEELPALIAKTLTAQAQEAANRVLTDAANDLRATAETLRDAQAQSPTKKGGTNAGRKPSGG
jgi:hypothetical protein